VAVEQEFSDRIQIRVGKFVLGLCLHGLLRSAWVEKWPGRSPRRALTRELSKWWANDSHRRHKLTTVLCSHVSPSS
jgi:hypothetical protein